MTQNTTNNLESFINEWWKQSTADQESDQQKHNDYDLEARVSRSFDKTLYPSSHDKLKKSNPSEHSCSDQAARRKKRKLPSGQAIYSATPLKSNDPLDDWMFQEGPPTPQPFDPSLLAQHEEVAASQPSDALPSQVNPSAFQLTTLPLTSPPGAVANSDGHSVYNTHETSAPGQAVDSDLPLESNDSLDPLWMFQEGPPILWPLDPSLLAQHEEVAASQPGDALPSQATSSVPPIEPSSNAAANSDGSSIDNTHETSAPGQAVDSDLPLESNDPLDAWMFQEGPPTLWPLDPSLLAQHEEVAASQRGDALPSQATSSKKHQPSEKATKRARYYQAHKEEIAAKRAAHRQANKAEVNAKQAAYNQAHKEKITAYNQAHKEEIAANQAAYRQAHKEEIAATQAAWYQANKAELKAKQAAYYQANKAELKAKQAAYYQANKEEITVRMAAYRQAHKK